MGISPFKQSILFRALRVWPAVAFAGLLLVVGYKFYSGGPIGFFGQTAVSPQFLELGGRRLPQYSAITPAFIRSVGPLLIVGLVLTLLTLRFMSVVSKSQKSSSVVHAGNESGASAVEFVLVLPALAIMLLMILQIALVVQAKFVVNYAAFCAARSAIVVIPDDVSISRPPESHNRLGNPETSEKVEIIRRSAALPLTAISPLPGFSTARGVPVLTNPEPIAELIKLAPFDVGPRSMMGQVMLRAPYAYHPDNTLVKVLDAEGNEARSFRDHDWVTVKVGYRYYLAVPFAKRLFGTAYSDNSIWNMLFGTDYYYPIIEQYTLPVDGEPMLPS
jgi:hypothetical protein